jgi:hypothetical protein
MSTENNWKEMNGQADDDLSGMLNISEISKLQSKTPLQQLKRNLRINIIWGLIIDLFYLAILIAFAYWQVRVAISVVFLFSLWALYTAIIQYKKIPDHVSADRSLLSELKKQHQAIVRWCRMLENTGLFIYPVSAAGGFMLGGAIGSGKDIDVFLRKPLIIILFFVVIAILTPACHYLAKWMNKVAFGKHLEALQKNIQELESEQ